MAELNLTVRCDKDYLRLVAYREVLREIATGEVFDPAAEVARAVLEHFGDDQERTTDG